MKKQILLLGSILALCGCSKSVEHHYFSYGYFDSYVDIKLFEGEEQNLQELQAILNKYSKITDNYLATDLKNIYTINNTNEPVEVSEELYKVLKQTQELEEDLSYLNMMVGSLSKKWKEAISQKQVLSNEIIASELDKVCSSTLTLLENNTVQKTGSAEIDLGAVAKGFALDAVKTDLSNKNISKYIVDAGSSSILLGEKDTEDGLFTIRIKDLGDKYLKLKNCVISTSSVKEQSETINGKTYSHIVNPETGEATPINDGVIVITDSGYIGDALSTTMMMCSVTEVQSLENNYHAKAIIIRNGSVVYQNKGIRIV